MWDELMERLGDKKAWLAGLVVLGLALGGWVLRPQPPEPEALALPLVASKEQEAVASEEDTGEAPAMPQIILVDVKGAVVKSGVYELPAGSRVQDAVAAAGGLSQEADSRAINLAQKLVDEALVYVPYQGEEAQLATLPAGGTDQGSSKVNLNTADLAQLMTISGIGEKRAKDILAYRESSGGFQSIDDLTKVSGIGQKTLERIREEVSLD